METSGGAGDARLRLPLPEHHQFQILSIPEQLKQKKCEAPSRPLKHPPNPVCVFTFSPVPGCDHRTPRTAEPQTQHDMARLYFVAALRRRDGGMGWRLRGLLRVGFGARAEMDDVNIWSCLGQYSTHDTSAKSTSGGGSMREIHGRARRNAWDGNPDSQ